MDLQSIMPELRRLARSNNPADPLNAAMLLALTVLKGQYRYPGKREPSASHSLRVGLMLERFGDDPTTIIGGHCHDLIEDTKLVTPKLLKGPFGVEVMKLVQACSLNKKLYKSNNQRGNEDLIRRVRAHGKRAVAVKLADVTDNLATTKLTPITWQEELLWCAERYLILGYEALGPSSSHVVGLLAAIEQATTYP